MITKYNDFIASIINESVSDEIERLISYGYEQVERFTFGSYDMILLKGHGIYEVALSSDDSDFTTFDSQVKKQTNKDLLSVNIVYKKLVEKLKEWIDTYGEMYVGSFNKHRAYKYKQLLSSLGLSTSDVEFCEDESWFDSWNFIVSK